MQEVSFDQLSETYQKALKEASLVARYSYSPYSGFLVGAALVSGDGDIITGTNFENAAYGSTICAERAAVLRANSMGLRKFTGIAIIARKADSDTTEVTAPCGSCRQVLFELSEISATDLEVVLSTTKMDKIVLTSVGELLPLAFGRKTGEGFPQ